MSEKNEIRLTKEKREEIITLIKNYFSKERGEEIGHLASSLILDFIIDKIAPEFYNQGVYDSYEYLSDRLDDMLAIQK